MRVRVLAILYTVQHPIIPEDCPSDLRELMKECWATSPTVSRLFICGDGFQPSDLYCLLVVL